MKHNRPFWKMKALFVVLLLAVCALRHASAADAVFKSPVEASAAWAATNATTEVKQSVVAYLNTTLDSAAPDSALFTSACEAMAKIYTAEKNHSELIALRQRQMQGAGDNTTLLYSSGIALSDAYVAAGADALASKVLVDLLENHPSSADFSAAWTKLTLLLRKLKQDAEMIRLSAVLLARERDPIVVNTVATALSLAYAGMLDYANAAQVLDTYLERNREQAGAAQLLAAVKSLVAIQTTNLDQPDAAVMTLDREIDRCAPSNSALKAEMIILKAGILQNSKKDPAAAVGAYEAALPLADQLPAAGAQGLYMSLSRSYQEIGEQDKAVGILLEGLDKSAALTSTQFVSALIAIVSQEEPIMKAAYLVHKKIVAELEQGRPVDPLQTEVIRLLVNAGKSQEALQEGRIMFYTCPEKSLPAAIEQIAWIFKSSDGNLGRANAFLNYQKYGPAGEDGEADTADDIPDLLKDVPPVSDKSRNALYETYIRALPTDWQGYKNRGHAFLYVDRPDESFQAYRRAFELCPMVEKDLQSVTDGVTSCIVRMSRNPALGEQFVEYVMFGPAGKDGRLGSPDDIKDPVPEILAMLSSSGVKQPAEKPKREEEKPES